MNIYTASQKKDKTNSHAYQSAAQEIAAWYRFFSLEIMVKNI